MDSHAVALRRAAHQLLTALNQQDIVCGLLREPRPEAVIEELKQYKIDIENSVDDARLAVAHLLNRADVKELIEEKRNANRR